MHGRPPHCWPLRPLRRPGARRRLLCLLCVLPPCSSSFPRRMLADELRVMLARAAQVNRLGLVMAYPEVEALVGLVGQAAALEILLEARVRAT